MDRERAGAAEGAENAAGSTAGSAGGDAGRDAGGDAGGDAVQTPADATTGVVVPVVAAAQTARAQAAPGQAAESQGVGSGAGPGDAEEENQLRNRLARQRYDADLAALILGLPLRYLPAHSSTLSPTHPAHPSQNPPPPHTSTPTTSPTAPNTITDPIPPTASAAPDLVILAGFMHILSPSFLTPLNTHTPGSVPVLNLHPALPGAYDGANALSRAWTDWEQGARVVPALPPRSSRSSERGRSRSASASAPSGEGKSEAGERRDEDRTAAAVSSTPSDPPKPERRRIAYTGCMVHHVISEVDRGPPVLARKVSFRVGEAREDFERRFRVDENRLVVDAVRVFLAGNGGEGKEGGRWFGVLGEEGMVYLQI